jgi:lysophospholipase L1-like esterase
MRKNCFLAFLSLVLLVNVNAQDIIKSFVKGDRVVFAGNSITEAGFYESYIWLYYMTHFPEIRIDIFNGGVGGDVAGQIYTRLDGDILAKKPTVVAVTFGMNDSRYFEYQKPGAAPQVMEAAVKESYNSFLKIQEKLSKLTDIRKIIMTTSPYDETMKNDKNYFPGKSATIEKIAQFQEEAARKNNWGFVDFLRPMTEMNLREQKKTPEFTLTGDDRIHPGPPGHLVMAYLFLKKQGLAGKPVSDIKINASKKKVLQSVNCSITNLSSKGKILSFGYLANSLPYPLDTVPRIWMNPHKQTEALEVIPFVKEFDSEMLTIEGLTGEKYRLSIDNKPIGEWSAKDFVNGINLALLHNTPQYLQAEEIMDLNHKRHEIEAKFRNYYWVEYNFLNTKGLSFNDSQAVGDTVAKYAPINGWPLNTKKDDYEAVRAKESHAMLQNQMDGFVNRIYELNKPKNHQVKIEQI